MIFLNWTDEILDVYIPSLLGMKLSCCTELLLVRLLWSIDDKWLYARSAAAQRRLYDNIGTL